MRCGRGSLGGGSCERRAGHDGPHRKTMWRYDYHHPENPPEKRGTYEWTDEDLTEAIKGWEGRLD